MTHEQLREILKKFSLPIQSTKISQVLNYMNQHPDLVNLLNINTQNANIIPKQFDSVEDMCTALKGLLEMYNMLGDNLNINRLLHLKDTLNAELDFYLKTIGNYSDFDVESQEYCFVFDLCHTISHSTRPTYDIIQDIRQHNLAEELLSNDSPYESKSLFVEFLLNHFKSFSPHERKFILKQYRNNEKLELVINKIKTYRKLAPNTNIPDWVGLLPSSNFIKSIYLNKPLFMNPMMEQACNIIPRPEFWYYLDLLADFNTTIHTIKSVSDAKVFIYNIKQNYRHKFPHITEDNYHEIIKTKVKCFDYFIEVLSKKLGNTTDRLYLDNIIKNNFKSFNSTNAMLTNTMLMPTKNVAILKLKEFVDANQENINKVKYLISIDKLDALLNQLVNINGVTYFNENHTILLALSSLEYSL